jgi:hypothetical protein
MLLSNIHKEKSKHLHPICTGSSLAYMVQEQRFGLKSQHAYLLSSPLRRLVVEGCGEYEVRWMEVALAAPPTQLRFILTTALTSTRPPSEPRLFSASLTYS